MKKILLLIIFPYTLYAQWHDANGHFSGTPNYAQGAPHKAAVANFQGKEPVFSVLNSLLANRLYSVSMSDSAGNLLFYSNGMRIFNKAHTLMENGDYLNNGEVASDPQWATWGYPVYFSTLCLPEGGGRYYLFHCRRKLDCAPSEGSDILYTVIDMNANDGLGKVVEKNEYLKGCEKAGWCSISSTRHANGQDWWVLASKQDHNRYYRIRLSPDGITDTITMTIDGENGYWHSGQSIFSPDGSKYIDCRNGRSVRVYEFDRCLGTLGTYQEIPAKSDAGFGLGLGAACSPNSRFLYLTSSTELVQAELSSADIPASVDTIAVFDGFYDDDIYHNAYFGLMQLMPNGIVYSAALHYNQTRYLHQIRFPNRKGMASNPILHSIRSPISVGTIPIFPNYRLGPLDESSCDTLGIDNLPLAHFRWDVEDTLSPLAVNFTDLSYYEPATWSWDFGDPGSGSANMSQDTSPVHTFSASGVYDVCLSVCNVNTCDTVCKEVRVGLTSIEDEPLGMVGDEWWVWPNPVQDVLNITQESLTGIANVQISNLEGRVLVSKPLYFSNGQATLSFVGLPQGVYLMRIADDTGEKYWMQRVVKM